MNTLEYPLQPADLRANVTMGADRFVSKEIVGDVDLDVPESITLTLTDDSPGAFKVFMPAKPVDGFSMVIEANRTAASTINFQFRNNGTTLAQPGPTGTARQTYRYNAVIGKYLMTAATTGVWLG